MTHCHTCGRLVNFAIWYFSRVYYIRNEGKFEVDTFEDNKASYLGMEIEKIDTPDFKGVILDSNNYEGKINHIEISQDRSKQKDDFLTDEEQSAMRSELGKLMWLARIARPDAIYDASAAARNFLILNREIAMGELLLGWGEMERKMTMLIILSRVISNTFLDLNFAGNKSGSANKLSLSKQRKKADTSKTPHGGARRLLWEVNRSQGARDYSPYRTLCCSSAGVWQPPRCRRHIIIQDRRAGGVVRATTQGAVVHSGEGVWQPLGTLATSLSPLHNQG